MSVQNRQTALQGEYVRLYCIFERDGMLADPAFAPIVNIVGAGYNAESSSSSSSLSETSSSHTNSSSSTWNNHVTGFGPFVAKKENMGIWYADWLVPEGLTVGQWWDLWTFQWDALGVTIKKLFTIDVHTADTVNQWASPPIAINISNMAASLSRDLSHLFLYEAQHIPIYFEQGYLQDDSRTLNFAYGNWNPDFRPIVRLNNRIVASGWTTDYNGHVIFERSLDADDQVYVTYKFAYFSDAELVDFLVSGLYAMNTVPPASEYYTGINSIPYSWVSAILLYAAMTGLQRLIFGLNFQEKSIIFGENPDQAQKAIDNFAKLYADYDELWKEMAKNVKSKRLPSISMYVSPEYTLPGGRCLSSDTFIKCKINNEEYYKTIKILHEEFENNKQVSVLSLKNSELIFAPVRYIWKSGQKMTYVLKTLTKSIRLSKEHLVYFPNNQSFKPVFELKLGDDILVVHNNKISKEKLLSDPIPYKVEEVYDIEVPSTENFVGNGIVSHNSRWFRYLYSNGI